MEIAKPTFSIFLDTRTAKKDSGNYPVKLRVTFKRERQYIGLDYDLSEDDFKKLNDGNAKIRSEQLKERRIFNSYIIAKAEDIAKELESFSFTEFKRRFLETEHDKEQNRKNLIDVYHAIEKYIEQLNKENRITTASSYLTALNSFKAFKKKLTFDDVTPDYLKDYERFMIDAGRSSTTIGIYLRNLRTIVNQAIDNGVIDKAKYPFKKSKFQIPASKNIKKALSLDDIGSIYNYEAEPHSFEDRAKDFWIFSYLCNGINIKDICRLKFKDIDGDNIIFVRAKTALTRKGNQQPIIIPLGDDAKAVIKKWGNADTHKENYIFSILERGLTPKRELELVQYFTKSINKYMKRIVTNLGIKRDVTTYFARHSFATVLKRGGKSNEFIKESLGHNSIKTTDSYLDSFEDEDRKDSINILTNFKKK